MKKRKSLLKTGKKGVLKKEEEEEKQAGKSSPVEKEVRFVDGASSMNDTDLSDGTCANNVMQISLWFPIRSMFLFQTVILMIECPRLIPGLCFCYIGMILCHFMVARYVRIRLSEKTTLYLDVPIELRYTHLLFGLLIILFRFLSQQVLTSIAMASMQGMSNVTAVTLL